MRLLIAAAASVLIGACTFQLPPPAPAEALRPPPHAIDAIPVRQAAATANPHATRAALSILEEGGSPVDAAIAAQMVLGLVEPQSSGIGGGTLIMYWDAAGNRLTSFDGLAAAPERATAALGIDADGTKLKSADVQRGGRSIGVPGTLAVLKLAHSKYGKLPWERLFAPAIDLAERGFPLPAYLHGVLSSPTAAADHPDMASLYFDASGKVLAAGTTVKNPVYAETLRRIARLGPAGLVAEGHGTALIAAAQRGKHASLMTEADLAAYRPEERQPLCAPFLVYSVCAMAPPSFGGVVVLQILQMLEARPIRPGAARFDFDDPAFVHYYAEAGKLAQADRIKYIGDPGFVRVPAQELVAPNYLKERARLIDTAHATNLPAAPPVSDATSQLAIVDREGNALSMTTTINLNFGSRLMVDGFVLNDAMTNFAPAPDAANPNRMQPRKRPVTSMAPVIVFDTAGAPVVVGGSAGGGQIVDYISESLVEMLGNQRTPVEAIARGHVSTAIRGKLQLERGTPAAAQAEALKAMGHDVDLAALPSGLGFLKRVEGGWLGAADPSRDGIAQGR
ncbi:MAG: gamma-glutamyltransferase family protein [Ramlibacter sp.]